MGVDGEKVLLVCKCPVSQIGLAQDHRDAGDGLLVLSRCGQGYAQGNAQNRREDVLPQPGDRIGRAGGSAGG